MSAACLYTPAPSPNTASVYHVSFSPWPCSALRDSRFSPVQLKEVAHLSCSVSLLCSFERAQGWQDWQIGQHGLIIEFVDPVLQCKRTATFLPEVAADQGWSQRQCIESLVRKAGESIKGHTAAMQQGSRAQRVWSTALTVCQTLVCTIGTFSSAGGSMQPT